MKKIPLSCILEKMKWRVSSDFCMRLLVLPVLEACKPWLNLVNFRENQLFYYSSFICKELISRLPAYLKWKQNAGVYFHALISKWQLVFDLWSKPKPFLRTIWSLVAKYVTYLVVLNIFCHFSWGNGPSRWGAERNHNEDLAFAVEENDRTPCASKVW